MFGLKQRVDERRHYHFTFADNERVENFSQRFRVERRARAARNDYRVELRPFRRARIDFAEPQHFHGVEVIGLKRHREADCLKAIQRRLRLHAQQPVEFGQKKSFASRVRPRIQQLINYVYAEVRHADAIRIRIRQRESQPPARLPDKICFALKPRPQSFFVTARN